MGSLFVTLLGEICAEQGIALDWLSRGWVARLRRGGQTRFLAGEKFDLNGHALGSLLDDKYATYCVLQAANVPVVAHQILYAPDNQQPFAQDHQGYAPAHQFWRAQGGDMVVKPNDGACGCGVYRVRQEAAIDAILEQLWAEHYSLSLCPYVDAVAEYRLIMLADRLQLCYRKQLPVVTGDGRRSRRQLLSDFNPSYFTALPALAGQEFDQVPAVGEEYYYNWQFNLSRGARAALDVTQEQRERLTALAHQAVAATGLVFGSVDIIVDRQDRPQILEINSAVSTDKFLAQHLSERSRVKAMYSRALEQLFK